MNIFVPANWYKLNRSNCSKGQMTVIYNAKYGLANNYYPKILVSTPRKTKQQ